MTHSCSKHLVRVQKTVCESSTYEGLKGFLKYYSTELDFHEIAICFLQYEIIKVTFWCYIKCSSDQCIRSAVLLVSWKCGIAVLEAPDGKERNIRKHWTLVQGKWEKKRSAAWEVEGSGLKEWVGLCRPLWFGLMLIREEKGMNDQVCLLPRKNQRLQQCYPETETSPY